MEDGRDEDERGFTVIDMVSERGRGGMFWKEDCLGWYHTAAKKKFTVVFASGDSRVFSREVTSGCVYEALQVI